MKKLSTEQVSARFAEREAAGHHVDGRLKRRLNRDTDFYEIVFDDQDSFLSIIWQCISDVQIVAPPGEPRDLRSVANRIVKAGWSFARLASDPPISKGTHDPKWFDICFKIDRDFSYQDFGEIAIRPLNEHEEKSNPRGTFYIHDGNHKTLVLATKLLRQEVDFSPITALYVRPSKVETDD